jgi:hypothetical protein
MNKLYQKLVQRDFGINDMPEGFNDWRQVHLFYNNIITNPVVAIPHVEYALSQKREGFNLTPFYRKLLGKYKESITNVRSNINGIPVHFIAHRLELYNPITDEFYPRTSLDQIRVLRSNENYWRSITPSEVYSFDMRYICDDSTNYFNTLYTS